MTVTSPHSIRADQARVLVVVVLAVLQVLVGALGATGRLGMRVGDVAHSVPSPVLAADWAFLAWVPVYVGFLAYAGYQCFPRQKHRAVHRRTGWWLGTAALCNVVWVLTWTAGWLVLAELALIVLTVVLAVAFGRLSHEPAGGWPERLALRLPVSLYTGWASVALVMGTAATGVWLGLPGENAIAVVAGMLVLAAVAAILVWVVLNGTGVVGYAAAAVWGLAGIAAVAPEPVTVTAALVGLVVSVATVWRLASAAKPVRAAFG